ncbi:MAG TPA: MFS transporter [Xanthobacteraceae bacterium]|nr:MFS transporter [Xanthobacteraceae bacterium]
MAVTESRVIGGPDRRVVVTALGVTQIFAWGSTFYLLAVLAPYVARDTGWRYDLVVAGASVGLLVAGILSPRVGRLIANHGGRAVLAVGAMLLASGLAAVGLAPTLPVYWLAWAIVGAGMGAGLYDAAFSTLGNIYGSHARGAITAVTLFGGLASTVCWPLSAFLVERLGWRDTCFVYAGLQIFLCLPLHLVALPRSAERERSQNRSDASAARLQSGEPIVFAILAAVLTIGAAILSTVGTHLLPLLQARGLDLAFAVGLGAMVGPSQVGARVIEMLASRHYHPVWTMIASSLLVAVGAIMLFFNAPVISLALILYGAGNGIGSIARGTLPLALFGPQRYPVLMGRLALPLLVAMAISPYLGGLVFARSGADWTFGILMVLALANVLLAAALRLLVIRKG